jgi:predicted transcriptional regulator of viral defense system
MKDQSWMKAYPVFSLNLAVRHIGDKDYAKQFLHRKKMRKEIINIKNGLYSASQNVFAVASNIIHPSYISHLSASYLYGATQTIPIRIHIASPKRIRSIEFSGYKIEFITSKSLWGFHKEKMGNEEIFLVDYEKLLIDAFDKPQHMGNFSEIENLYENSQKIDVQKVKDYLLRKNSERIYRQVGYMLQKHRNVDIFGLMRLGRNYFCLDKFSKSKKIERKWRLFI